MACVLKTSIREYDLPFRLKEAEFSLVLRHMNELTIDAVIQRISEGFRTATNRILPGVVLPLEFAHAIYPYDAENIPGLFSSAEKHWMVSPPPLCSWPVQNGHQCRHACWQRHGCRFLQIGLSESAYSPQESLGAFILRLDNPATFSAIPSQCRKSWPKQYECGRLWVLQ
jgi:hypothetical protein